MSSAETTSTGPDLAQGIRAADLGDGQMLAGHVGEDAVLLARRGAEFFAIGATCTHYSGPLAEGIIAGETVRCPWHHACFSLRTGEALRAPALSPVACWAVESVDGKVFVRGRKKDVSPDRRHAGAASEPPPGRVVIVGGGAAGFAAAEMLRRERFQGSIVMLTDDDSPPVDRPNLSKDYLAGNAPEDWIALRPPDYYADQGIDLHLRTQVAGIDLKSRAVALTDGRTLAFDRLLLATGAEPNRLSFPGSQAPHVFTLRTLADSRAIIERARTAQRAVVVGASFIGLEVAGALRARSIQVDVVAPESRPMHRILGEQLGDFVRTLHERHAVRFHLEDAVQAIDGSRVLLKSGLALEADLVVMGVGVRARTELAQAAGLALDRGVLVNPYLETSAPGVYAAGDIARWPDPRSGEPIRVEHWVVAQRQGQTAARNIIGYREKFDAVPFFWSQHYDVQINYVGHAESWDRIEVDGDIDARDCVVRYKRGGRVLAVASIFRDIDSLKAELALEREALAA
ncbi:MAG TPA: FAD-dependent oxidoreductase [Burkholderiaceae bacterium]|jgi:NADPH-dependent 2,4-dienoyl-CoA reductase/sulfur reductase-like enzyme/nitrite reductase/ring-hydroxylating ferredoxin subunit|nr:FAD-dependent oxidoreductase [Burkholderiaceae bacterium]